MISMQHIEESLSISYVNAVVAYSGMTFNPLARDYGVDGSVHFIDSLNGKFMDMGSKFDCQLKSTINWNSNGSDILYDIDAESYNKLVHRNESATVPCYLILLCLPKDRNDWLAVNPTELILRQCCYYHLIEGEQTKNKSSIRVHIPKTNIFNSIAVNHLINSSKRVVSK